jgi:hypothetical protein
MATMIPVSIGNEVFKRFALTISQQPLGLVHHVPEPSAQPMLCIENVLEKVSRYGGRPVYGWAFLPRVSPLGPYLIAMHHSVWQAPRSTAAVDITPFHDDPKHRPYCPQAGSILFLWDVAAEPKRIGHAIAPLPSRFFPVNDDPRLAEYLAKLGRDELEQCEKLYEGALAAHLGSEHRQ